MRLVTLACSNTEIVCALGCGDMLVGTDDHSDYPPELVEHLPRVGPDLTPSMDAIAELRPDLVIASLTVPGHEKVIANLEDAGLPYVAYEPTSVEDVYADIQDIADHLGVRDRGFQVAGDLRGRLEAKLPALPGPPPSIAVQWWPKPVILPGRQSWVHDLLDRVGATHPLAEEEVKSRPMEDDELRRHAPDGIVISWCGVELDKYRPDVVLNNPAWQDLEAIRGRRVYPVAEAFLGRPSPLLADGFTALRHIAEELAGGLPAPVRSARSKPAQPA